MKTFAALLVLLTVTTSVQSHAVPAMSRPVGACATLIESRLAQLWPIQGQEVSFEGFKKTDANGAEMIYYRFVAGRTILGRAYAPLTIINQSTDKGLTDISECTVGEIQIKKETLQTDSGFTVRSGK